MQNETIGSLFELFGIAIKRFISGIPFIGLLLVGFFASSYISLMLIAKLTELFKGEGEDSGMVAFGIVIGALLIIIYLATLTCIAVACVTSSKGDLKQDFNNFIMLITTRSIKLTVALIIQFLIIVVGFICFIVPGVYFSYRMLVLPQVVMYENKGFSEAFERSSQIMDGSKLMALLTSLILKIIFFVIGLVLAMVLATVFGLGADEELKGMGEIIYNLYSFSYEIMFIIFFNLIYLKRREIQ